MAAAAATSGCSAPATAPWAAGPRSRSPCNAGLEGAAEVVVDRSTKLRRFHSSEHGGGREDARNAADRAVQVVLAGTPCGRPPRARRGPAPARPRRRARLLPRLSFAPACSSFFPLTPPRRAFLKACIGAKLRAAAARCGGEEERAVQDLRWWRDQTAVRSRCAWPSPTRASARWRSAPRDRAARGVHAPKSYLELIALYKRQLQKNRDRINLLKVRLSDGLVKLRDAEAQVADTSPP